MERTAEDARAKKVERGKGEERVRGITTCTEGGEADSKRERREGCMYGTSADGWKRQSRRKRMCNWRGE